MEDLIKRSDAIKIMACEMYAEAQLQGYEVDSIEDFMPEAKAWMNDAPSADRPSAVDLSSVYSTAYKSGYEKGKADRPQGEWIYGEHDVAMCDGYRCDRCGFFIPWDYEHKFIDFINDYNFCPSCGSKMRGEHDD